MDKYKVVFKRLAQMPRTIALIEDDHRSSITPQGSSSLPLSAPLRVMVFSYLAAVSLFHVGW